MRKYVLFLLMLLSSTMVFGQSMTDQAVYTYISKETSAGTSQAQIVTKLMQGGAKIDQIRRVRQMYDKNLKENGQKGRTDVSVGAADARLRSGGTGDEPRQVTLGQDGSTQDDLQHEADIQYAEIQQNINQHVDGEVGEAKLKVFGRDIFNNKLLSFEPNMNIATPQNYVLGPGDVVIIDIYGASQRSENFSVSPDGDITVPGFGPIKVGGLSVAAAQSRIRSTLGSRYSSSSLKIALGQTRSIMVNVMGEVKAPGTYTLSAFATVFHALYMAGGINRIGTLRNVKVFRNGKLITVVDVYEYILNGRLAGNIRLQENDVIVVGPYDCLVGIEGSVKRPMFYEMRPSESVSTIVEYAGGFTGDAYKKAIRLIRKSGERYSVHTVEEFDMAAFKLTDGDNITVDGMINRYENMVEVKGAVFRPGQYELGKDITSVRSLIEFSGGLTEDAFTARGVMYRMTDDRTLETIPVDIAGVMAGTVADVPLQNEDVLFIPTQADRVAERIVTIYGEVLNPGTFQFSNNETIEDLVLRAGGLTDAASTIKVDVSRRIRDPKALKAGQEISKTYSFALKDGFVVDGDKGFVLEPYDIVQVRRSPGYMAPRNVRVEGEVVFEGSFTLSKKNQRITDLVEAAGGLTAEAYVKGARLIRTMTSDERARLRAAIETAKQNTEDKDTIKLSQMETSNVYSVGIDLGKAMANPGGDYDVVLRAGDRLVIPEYNGTVKISGNVLFPNTVTYMNGKKWKYYINQAGGFGDRSKKSKTYIVYQNGTVSQIGKGKVEPGCEIIVPVKGRRDMANMMQWVSLGSSMASLATMFATIGNLIK